MLDEINALALHGGAAGMAKGFAAGVLLRQHDAMADDARPWLPCARGPPLNLWCGPMGDRWPASIVNHRHYGTYSPYEGGIIFNMGRVRIRCGYAGDGSSMGKGEARPAAPSLASCVRARSPCSSLCLLL